MGEHPDDLAAVQADDALLDAIGGGRLVVNADDEELTRVLVGWRREVHAVPLPELVDQATALAAVRGSARMPWWNRVQVWVLARVAGRLTRTPR
jgi:hypothetical protein